MIKKLEGILEDNFKIGFKKSDYFRDNYIKTLTTTNETATTAFSLNINTLYGISTYYRVNVIINVLANRTDVKGESADYYRYVTFNKIGTGNITRLANQALVTRESNNQWEYSTVANTTNQTIDFVCTGQTGKTIEWYLFIETIIIKL